MPYLLPLCYQTFIQIATAELSILIKIYPFILIFPKWRFYFRPFPLAGDFSKMEQSESLPNQLENQNLMPLAREKPDMETNWTLCIFLPGWEKSR